MTTTTSTKKKVNEKRRWRWKGMNKTKVYLYMYMYAMDRKKNGQITGTLINFSMFWLYLSSDLWRIFLFSSFFCKFVWLLWVMRCGTIAIIKQWTWWSFRFSKHSVEISCWHYYYLIIIIIIIIIIQVNHLRKSKCPFGIFNTFF